MIEFNVLNPTPLAWTLTLVGAFTILFGLYSLVIKEKLYLSEALVATLFGIMMGPRVIGVINPRNWGPSSDLVNSSLMASHNHSLGMNSLGIIEDGQEIVGDDGPFGNLFLTFQFTRIVIAIQLLASGVDLPNRYLSLHWKSMFVLLGPVMIYAWIFTGAAIHLILGIPWLKSLIIAGCIAPTDPILANSICNGRFADKHVPIHVRHLLSAESGANDGSAYPFIMIAFALLKYPADTAWSYWIVVVVLYQVILAIILGVVIGYVARRLLRLSERGKLIDKESFLSFEIALALFADGISVLLGMDDFLTVFATGCTLNWDGWFSTETAESRVQETLDNIINLAFFVYFGTLIPWDSYYAIDSSQSLSLWRMLVLGLVVMIGRRLPIVVALFKFTPSFITLREAIFAGFFGPIGAGAIFFSYFIQIFLLPTDRNTIPIVMFLVLTSVIVHGSCVSFFRLSVGIVRTLSAGTRTSSGRLLNIRAPRRPEGNGELVISGPVSAKKMWSNNAGDRSSIEKLEDPIRLNPTTLGTGHNEWIGGNVHDEMNTDWRRTDTAASLEEENVSLAVEIHE
ncbi:Sodium/hydrogen exchanger family-domain-containing protein [Paraphysoderma sedebokerense]|nr:Sodium/hydrogen exchanger family-domain-containing protein [Paraphysoderma sedebokerense]